MWGSRAGESASCREVRRLLSIAGASLHTWRALLPECCPWLAVQTGG